MKNCFNFNDQTANLLSPEQQRTFLSPFVMPQDEYTKTLHTCFPAAYKRAGQQVVRDITVMVIANVQEHLRKYPAVLILPDEQIPATWGYACRYRTDVPWYVCAVSGKYDRESFNSYPVVNLGFYNDLHHWPPLDTFISNGLWGVQQNKLPTWHPLVNFVHSLTEYVRADDTRNIFDMLRTSEFFPADETILSQLEFTLERDDSFDTLTEIHALARTVYPCLVNPTTEPHWTKVLNHTSTQTWVARSRNAPHMVLGFLIGGIANLTEQPEIHAVAVLPDERRRGIGRSLVNRFFAQTGYSKVIIGTEMGPRRFEYEACGFLQALGGEVEKKYSTVWRWKLPSTLLNKAKRQDELCANRK